MATTIKDLKSEIKELKDLLLATVKREVKAAVDHHKTKRVARGGQDIEAQTNVCLNQTGTSLSKNVIKRKQSPRVMNLKPRKKKKMLQSSESDSYISEEESNDEQTNKSTDHECKICHEKFSRRILYNKHILIHKKELNNDSGGFKCPLCEKTFEKTRHLFIHHVRCSNGKELQCQACKTSFTTFDDLTVHYHTEHFKIGDGLMNMLEKSILRRRKDESQRLKLTCKTCMQIFTNSKLFSDHTLGHLQEIHNCPQLLYNCPMCEGSYSTIWDFIDHLNCHENSNQDCQECKENFENGVCLILHYYKIHFGAPEAIKDFLCEILSNTKLNLAKPPKKESGFNCDICSKKFRTESGYKNHLTTFHNSRTEHIISNKSTIAVIKDSYKCSACDKQFEGLKGLQLHTAHHTASELSAASKNLSNSHTVIKTKSRVYNCKACPESFYRIFQFRKHIVEYHMDNKELTDQFCFNCDLCDESFHCESSLIYHKKKHGIFVQCPICKENCSTKETFTNHLNDVHSESQSQNFLEFQGGVLCKLCGDKLSNIAKFTKHMETNHSEKPYMCDICGKSFAFQILLKRHSEVVHTDRTLLCKECGKRFKTSNALKSHLKLHARKNAGSRISCAQCDKTFSNEDSYHRHFIAVHNNEKPFKCKKCGQGFSFGPQLHLHKITVCEKETAKISHCDICDKSFENYIGLFYHKANIHRYGNTDDNTCRTCNKTFDNSTKLYQHNRNYHTGENGETVEKSESHCKVCGQPRPNQNLLFDHWLTHRPEKVFKCEPCNIQFKQRCGFFQHKKHTHKTPELKQIRITTDHSLLRQLKTEFKELHTTTSTKVSKADVNGLPLRPEGENRSESNKNTDLNLPKSGGLNYVDFSRANVPAKPQMLLEDQSNNSELQISDDQVLDVDITDAQIPSYIDFSRANVPAKHQVLLDDRPNNSEPAISSGLPKDVDTADQHIPSYVDFSKTNVPAKHQVLPEDKPKRFEPGTSSDQAMNVHTADQLSSYECEEDVMESDYGYGPPSPIDNSDDESDVLVDVKPFIFLEDDVPQDPFLKRVVIKLERLRECPVCKEYFTTLDLHRVHMKSKSHRDKKKYDAVEQRKDMKRKSKKEKPKDVLKENKRVKKEQNKESEKAKKERQEERKRAIKERQEERKRAKKERREERKRLKRERREEMKRLVKERQEAIKNVKLFSCSFCDEKFSSVDKFRRHSAQHKIRANCLLCTAKFVSVRKLVDHYISQHNGDKVVKCEICNKGYLEYNSGLREHMAMQHTEEKQKKVRPEKSYSCDVCGERSKGTKAFKDHLLSHANDKHECIHCAKEFKRQIKLEDHYNKVHNGEMPVPCGECPLRFLTQYRLELHKKEAHLKAKYQRDPSDGKIACDMCGQKFFKISELNYHKTTHNPMEERQKFVCEFCGKPFLRIHSLTIHRRLHTGEKPYICILCESDNAFTSSAMLNEHMDRVHNRHSLNCDICGKLFKRRKTLASHRKIHPMGGNGDNSCPNCFKVFPSATKLKNHIDNVHLPEGDKTPLICQVCEEEFYAFEAFEKHSELHNPDRPFGCDQCSFRFNYRGNLQLHIKGVHQKMGTVYPKKKKIPTSY